MLFNQVTKLFRLCLGFKNASLGISASLGFTICHPYSLQCVISLYVLTTRQLIIHRYCKEKMDVDKFARAERVNLFIANQR